MSLVSSLSVVHVLAYILLVMVVDLYFELRDYVALIPQLFSLL
jgi:hypothetical protein